MGLAMGGGRPWTWCAAMRTWETTSKEGDTHEDGRREAVRGGCSLSAYHQGCSDQKWRGGAGDNERVGELRRRAKESSPPPLRGAPIYPSYASSHAVCYVIADSGISAQMSPLHAHLRLDALCYHPTTKNTCARSTSICLHT